MAYDEGLAQRIRDVIGSRSDIEEKKMFGGIAFMLNGNMCCGVVKADLCLRLGKEGTAAALEETHVRPMDFTGKPLKTMVYVSAKGIADDADLEAWVERGMAFAETLPKK